jgi:hypothetical protein
MKGQWRKIVILILALILLASLSSCDLFTFGSGDNIDDEKVAKPEFKLAMDNYNTLNPKSSEFEGKILISLYGKDNKTYSAGERLNLQRIQNGNKIYVDGSISNENNTDNMQALLMTIKELFPQNASSILKSAIGYLDGTQSAGFSLGYDNTNSSYNLKAKLKNDIKTESIYYATNNEFVMNELLTKNINSSINVNDYLMFSTFVDFNNGSGWISSDEASAFFDNAKELGNYQMSVNGQKVYGYIIERMEGFIKSLTGEKFANDLEKYNECIDIIKDWVSIGESSTTASVNKNNLPVRMQTKTRINISFDIVELEEVLYKIYKDDESIASIMEKIKIPIGFILQSHTINMSIDLSFDESFKYDEESVSLDTVDQGLFIDAKEKMKGRVSYIIDENSNKETNTENTDE